MIKNGNYKWLNFDKIRPMMKQVFTEYYGEEYRTIVENIIDQISYVPFHKFDYVNEYYKIHIMNYKNEIVDNFCKLTKLRNTEALREAIMPNDVDILEDTPMSIIMGMEYRNKIYNQIKEDIDKGERQGLKKLFDALGINLENKEEAQAKLLDYIDKFMRAIKKVEKAHPCDVFSDMQTIENNFNKGMLELAEYAEKLGLPISDNDKTHILLHINHPEVFSLFDKVNGLDMCKDYLDRDISLPGLVDYFSTKYEHKLKNDNQHDKYYIYINRLRYLQTHGAKFEILSDEEVFNFNFTNANMPELLKRLEKEYKLQCIKNPELIVPTDKADLMEMKRLELQEKEHKNCKYRERKDKPTLKGVLNFSSHENAGAMMESEYVNNIFKRNRSLFFDEGLNDDVYAIISAMCHEINHAISSKTKTINCYSGIDYMGLVAQGFAMDYGEFVGYITDEPDIDMLYENINQRQTKELCGIYFDNYDTKGFFTSDIIQNDDYYDCKYEFVDFLTKDFYYIFYDEIKKQNIDSDYEIYYNVNLYNSKIERMKSKVQSAYNRRVHKKDYYSKEGIVDYHKVAKLGKLVSDWLDKYLPILYENEVSAEDLCTGACMSKFDYKMYRIYKDFIRKKEALIEDMYKDKNISNRLMGKVDKNITEDDIEYINNVLEENNLGGKE